MNKNTRFLLVDFVQHTQLFLDVIEKVFLQKTGCPWAKRSKVRENRLTIIFCLVKMLCKTRTCDVGFRQCRFVRNLKPTNIFVSEATQSGVLAESWEYERFLYFDKQSWLDRDWSVLSIELSRYGREKTFFSEKQNEKYSRLPSFVKQGKKSKVKKYFKNWNHLIKWMLYSEYMSWSCFV